MKRSKSLKYIAQNSLGKGEVEVSITSCSTIKSMIYQRHRHGARDVSSAGAGERWQNMARRVGGNPGGGFGPVRESFSAEARL